MLTIGASSAPQLVSGNPAPPFSAEATNGKQATQEIFKDKYYAFILEGQSTANKNIHVRYRIESIIAMLPQEKRESFIFFTVADVSSLSSLVHWIVRSKVKSNEQENKVTIYMDFKGEILKNFQLSQQTSNFVLVDNHGIIRFIKSGTVTEEELQQICSYLSVQFQAPYILAPIDISAAIHNSRYVWKPYLP